MARTEMTIHVPTEAVLKALDPIVQRYVEQLRTEFEEMTKLHDAKHQDWRRAEAERDALQAAIERIMSDCTDRLGYGQATAEARIFSNGERAQAERILNILAALDASQRPEDTKIADDEANTQWRRDEREIEGGFTGCEFPRLWPPRQRPEDTDPLNAAIECVLLDHEDEIGGDNADANISELAYVYRQRTGWTVEQERPEDTREETP